MEKQGKYERVFNSNSSSFGVRGSSSHNHKVSQVALATDWLTSQSLIPYLTKCRDLV
jgi:hypothetical protein